MEKALLIGLTLFNIALLVYSIATWAGVLSKKLKKWHLVLFWVGLIADVSGTLVIGWQYGGFVPNLHSYLGAIALVAMLAHNIAATKKLSGADEKGIAAFPKKISLPVWVIWMISYVAGLILSGSSH
ncbi:MAG: HsmA family protein [Chloroflexota bacterium]